MIHDLLRILVYHRNSIPNHKIFMKLRQISESKLQFTTESDIINLNVNNLSEKRKKDVFWIF